MGLKGNLLLVQSNVERALLVSFGLNLWCVFAYMYCKFSLNSYSIDGRVSTMQNLVSQMHSGNSSGMCNVAPTGGSPVNLC